MPIIDEKDQISEDRCECMCGWADGCRDGRKSPEIDIE